MPAFLALLNHVHNILSPTLHTPILLIAQPAWTAQDHEALTQFFFEKFKTPAFCIMDSALAVSYAYGVQNATVIDIGYQKVDVTAVSDFTVQHVGRTIALTNSGGDAMTNRLFELLGPKGWTKDMCEQLKKSSFCEILPAGTPLPGSTDTQQSVSNPAAAASAEANASAPSVKITEVLRPVDTDLGDDDGDIADKVVDDEGVLDVASIVASGKTQEFLAAQEKKKAMAASRKAAKDARDAADAATAKPVKLPNSKREKVIFHYQERKAPEGLEEVNVNGKQTATEDQSKKQKTPDPALAPAPIPAPETVEANATAAPTNPSGEAAAADSSVSVEDQAAKREQIRAAKREEKRKAREGQTDPSLIRREVEVGTERFLAASGGILDTIADSIHRTVLSVEVGKRSDLWDSLIIVGNGCKVRGKIFPCRRKHILTCIRIQRCFTRHSQYQIPYIAILGHNLHIRASVKPLHTYGYRCANSSTRIPSGTTSSSDRLFRQSPTLSCYNSLAPSAKPKHVLVIWWYEWPCSFFSLSKSDQHQDCKGP
jgi:actin-related protein 9